MKFDGIPEHLQPGLERFVLQGIRPGSFLCAVLSNDLAGAVMRASDHTALAALQALGAWLYNEAPASCWGSTAAVDAWIERGGSERRQRTVPL